MKVRANRTVAVGAILLATRLASAGVWLSDWVEHSGHRYRLTEPMDWWSAESLAVSSGGHLVTINDAAEDRWVYDTFLPYLPNGGAGMYYAFWIGFYQPLGSPEPAAGWQWISGEPVTYTNWDLPYEPNNGTTSVGPEDVAHILGPGAYGGNHATFWNDTNAWNPGGGNPPPSGLVEAVPEPARLCLLGLGGLLIARRRPGIRKSASALVAVGVLVASSHAWAASFIGLGDLPGGAYNSIAYDISADGSTVVGHSESASGTEAFRWRRDTGIQGLGDLAGGDFFSHAQDVSADGSVVVGWGHSASGTEAFRWTAADGLQGLGDITGGQFHSWSHGVSADGSLVTGEGYSNSGREAFRWTQGGGMQPMGDLPGGQFESIAYGVSADGSVIVGTGASASGRETFRWTTAGGMQGLGDLPGGQFYSWAYSVSADGCTVVGRSSSSSSGFDDVEAFRWTSSDGMVGLGDLPGGSFASYAHDVSGDGSVIVGWGNTAYGEEAFIWDAAHGMRNLKDVLSVDYDLDLTGWSLRAAYGISDSGMTIAGWGINPDGQIEGWVATVPEPATLSLLAAGGLLIARRRRT